MKSKQPRAVREYTEEDALALTSCAQTVLSSKTIQYPILKFDELRAVATPPVADLGCLHDLAIELQQMVLKHLNITSLSAFAKVNRAARQLVLDLPDLRFIVNNAPGCLSVLIRTTAAQWLSPADVRSIMRESRCYGCSAFTTLVDLLNCRRSCLECIMLEKHFTLARYRLTIYDVCQALQIPYQHFEVRTLKGIVVNQDRVTSQLSYQAHGPELYSLCDPQLVKLEGYDTAHIAAAINDWGWPTALMTHLMLPVCTSAAAAADHGLFCRGCQDEPAYRTQLLNFWTVWTETSALKQYSTEDFKKHAKSCRRAAALLTVRRSRRNVTHIAE